MTDEKNWNEYKTTKLGPVSPYYSGYSSPFGEFYSSGKHKMSRWRYFSDKESFGLVEDLMFKLDRARELFGHPIVITSGYRSPDHNSSVGGVDNSAHVLGRAVDVSVPVDQEMRERLIWSLCTAGFKRIGMYPRHAHVDIDEHDKPSPAFWVGVYAK